jgi:amino acid transporter
MFINLRGIRESGAIFSVPTYLFIFGMIALFGYLLYTNIYGTENLTASQGTVSLFPEGLKGISVWTVLVAFASGCTALTGVEAISNGVTAFKKPERENAKVTLITMGGILVVLFVGVTYFANHYGITPKYEETIVSQLARLSGNSAFYYFIQAATAGILFLAANTSFNDFPRVASLLAEDRFLPRQFASRGDRLVFGKHYGGTHIYSGLV